MLWEGVTLLNVSVESLKQVHERIFSSNAEAEEALKDLQMTRLTLLQARRILQNRIEAVN